MNERAPLLAGNFFAQDSKESKVSTLITNPSNSSFWRRRVLKKELLKYNEYQEHLMSLYMEDEKLLQNLSGKTTEQQKSIQEEESKMDRWLAITSFSVNICLLLANGTASYLSGSLAIISTFIDSLVDSTSGIVIFISSWAIKHTDNFNYPRGRARLELISVIICSIIMGIANIMMIVQSLESILNGTLNPDVNVPTVVIVLISCGMKIVLMVICLKHGTISAKTIALDMRNDLLTSVFALTGAYIGDKVWIYADPIGAIMVCTFVACSWFYNALANIPMLVGRRAQQESLSRIIRISIEHDSHIKCLDHVMVYHTGTQAIVEVHIVLDERLSLKLSHDIIESLTKKLSALPFVERAFVHGDYRCDGDWID